MSTLRELYQEQILDHNRSPRNFGPLENADREAQGFNPLCGDRVSVAMRVREGVVEEVKFAGKGCAISVASASMMTQLLRGKTVEECERLFDAFHRLVTGKECPVEALGALGSLAVFSGVREFPARVKCATLAWHSMLAALRQDPGQVSTE